MRTYQKQPPLAHLHTWHNSGQTWEDFARDRAAYEPVKNALRTEQQHLCCYCETELVPGHDHIDHFCPRHGLHGDVRRSFDYTNMGCSCNGGQDKNRHCGHYKGHDYDSTRFINPCSDQKSHLYFYDTDGKIGYTTNLSQLEQDQVDYMIRTLNLDCPRLTGMRRNAAHALQDMIQGMIENDCLDQLEDLALDYLAPNDEGKLRRFFSLSRQMFREYAPVTLALLEE
jgi:uncharacterized protein (TIGR02646 family)